MNWDLLRSVSRSFYLTMRMLPVEVRDTIALGYLLARASDSIADTSRAPLDVRLQALRGLQAGTVVAADLAGLSTLQPNDSERVLLQSLPGLLELRSQSRDRSHLDWVWALILKGQVFDLERFASSSLPLSADELDEYIFLVAGCVGEFWTRLCAERVPKFSRLPAEQLVPDGVRYGRGLQLVNILRDREADAANGRIYVSHERFEEVRNCAAADLDAGVRWVRAVDSGRMRMACVMPLRIGKAMLPMLRKDGGSPKVTRAAVRGIFARSISALWSRPRS